MKKIISMVLACMLSVTCVACGQTQKVKETSVQETVESFSDAEDIVKQEPHRVVEAAQGQYIEIDAKYGTYLVRVNGIEEVDWWQRKHGTNVKHVVLLHYEVQNISFSSILSEGVLLKPDSFRVTGDNDYTGKPFTTYYDGYEPAENVKPGETVSGTFAYEIDNPSRMPEFYYVTFKNATGDIAKVKVDF